MKKPLEASNVDPITIEVDKIIDCVLLENGETNLTLRQIDGKYLFMTTDEIDSLIALMKLTEPNPPEVKLTYTQSLITHIRLKF